MSVIKLKEDKVKEYRDCFINGLMDPAFIEKETGLSDRSVISLLYNEYYKDEKYRKSLNKIKPKYKFPFTLPIRKKYTEAVSRVLLDYRIPVEKRAKCLRENIDKITYDSQTAMYIDGENDSKYLLIIENSVSRNSGYLLPHKKYKIELVLETNHQYFSKFIYDKKDGIAIREINLLKNYWVTEDGRVISIGRGKILNQHINKRGYCQIALSINGRDDKTYRVHRLIAEAFIPNPDNKPQVNHINGIKSDNRVNNLEWVTNQENQIHAIKTGLTPIRFGENANASKLTNEEAETIRSLYSIGTYSQAQLGEMYNISSTAVGYIINNKTYNEGIVSALVQKETSPTQLENIVRK